jgi:hypothetical protein
VTRPFSMQRDATIFIVVRRYIFSAVCYCLSMLCASAFQCSVLLPFSCSAVLSSGAVCRKLSVLCGATLSTPPCHATYSVYILDRFSPESLMLNHCSTMAAFELGLYSCQCAAALPFQRTACGSCPFTVLGHFLVNAFWRHRTLSVYWRVPRQVRLRRQLM